MVESLDVRSFTSVFADWFIELRGENVGVSFSEVSIADSALTSTNHCLSRFPTGGVDNVAFFLLH